ncbi:8-oxo-dGTP diphosphatase MutT [Aliiglaciecola litoralis]|uniref:8-oxo-dGTP diphosphatase n=1 Tax=Aliiglaciecola litoralis TaxID=582857 RepID=A0ABN1LG56_9ALTE
MKIVDVSVGVIKQERKIFVSKRADELHQGGFWEFPGGKVEPDELPSEAMRRELFEEVGIVVTKQSPFMLIEHDYGDKHVRLHIFLIEAFDHQPTGKEGQQTQWVELSALPELAFPAANTPIVEKLITEFID